MLSRFVVSQVKHNSYFLVGVVIGLWVALAAIPLEEEVAACAEASTAALSDEFEPHREEKPLGPAGPAAGRSVQRPRYYSTELGMRGSLLAGVLSSEDALDSRVAALNQTAARLQPAFRVFIAASTVQAAPGRANVVGFTDTREMLKPFHALKYLADNYLEEYNFFFLVSDTSFVNARRLSELVSKLSVSQDVYMGTIAEDDSHYCTLEGGILLSNSVLRAVHGELDWCVRNSYSPRHHENLGRCVLHAAHQRCTTALQGESYSSARLEEGGALTPALADAVTTHPVSEPALFYRLHAYVSRVFLERDRASVARLRAQLVHTATRHPRGYRNATWPAGLRADPGLAAPPPDSRFDHLRWTLFNESHAFMPDDHRAVGLITGATKEALELVLRTARAWALNRWPEAEDVRLLEGAWRWEPPYALRYRLLLHAPPKQPAQAAPVSRILSLHVDWPEAEDVRLLEGAWRWEPPYALRYRLLLHAPPKQPAQAAPVSRILSLHVDWPEAEDVRLLEGAWRWEPPYALRYRLLLHAPPKQPAQAAPVSRILSLHVDWPEAEDVRLLEGAWRWEPPYALRYRLLLHAPPKQPAQAAPVSRILSLHVDWPEAEDVRLLEGAWRWEPPYALRYRLLLHAPPKQPAQAAPVSRILSLHVDWPEAEDVRLLEGAWRWEPPYALRYRLLLHAPPKQPAQAAPVSRILSLHVDWPEAEDVRLLEGAWRWEPPYALRYRLLLHAPPKQPAQAAPVSRILSLHVDWPEAEDVRLLEGAWRWEPPYALRYRLLLHAPPKQPAQAAPVSRILSLHVDWPEAEDVRLLEGAWRWEPPYALRYRLLLHAPPKQPAQAAPVSRILSLHVDWPEAEDVRLLEGAWRWEPPYALRYRLLLHAPPKQPAQAAPSIRSLEVVRGLGAARLAAAPYVTEAARVTLLLPLDARAQPDLPAFLRRLEAVCLAQDKNTQLVVVSHRPQRGGGGALRHGGGARHAAAAAGRARAARPARLPAPPGGRVSRAGQEHTARCGESPSAAWRRRRPTSRRRRASRCCCRWTRARSPTCPPSCAAWRPCVSRRTRTHSSLWCVEAAAPYVTEAARVTLLLPLDARAQPDLPAFLRRLEAVCLAQDKNTQLVVVVIRAPGEDESVLEATRAALDVLSARHRGASLQAVGAALAPAALPDHEWAQRLQKAVGAALAPAALPDHEWAQRLQKAVGAALAPAALPDHEWAQRLQKAVGAALAPAALPDHEWAQRLQKAVGAALAPAALPDHEWAQRLQKAVGAALAPAALPDHEWAQRLQKAVGAALAPAALPDHEWAQRLQKAVGAALAPAALPDHEWAQRLQKAVGAALAPAALPDHEWAQRLQKAVGAALAPAALPDHEWAQRLQKGSRGASLQAVGAALAPAALPDHEWAQRLQKVALSMALPRLSKDTLILLSVPHMEFNQDFLNRVRMNTIAGWQWYWALPFARYAQYAHPRFLDERGARPQQHTGRFATRGAVLAFYRRDWDAALAAWSGSSEAPVVEVLAGASLRCLRAPDPALVLAPRPPPCRLSGVSGPSGAASGPSGADAEACLRAQSASGFAQLELGDRHALAKLLLEERAAVHT
ncbi:uncharacterized protein LOC135082999 [Ostrinia nubilalis]|uniref:uncharacterized protein LOC135082999 n=1 Tax=Ostrinia nubilalis TaxID=29057 RepID=UPI00308239EC